MAERYENERGQRISVGYIWSVIGDGLRECGRAAGLSVEPADLSYAPWVHQRPDEDEQSYHARQARQDAAFYLEKGIKALGYDVERYGNSLDVLVGPYEQPPRLPIKLTRRPDMVPYYEPVPAIMWTP